MAAAASKAAPPDAVDAPVAAPRGKKKVMLMAIIGLAVLLVVGGGGAAFYVMKQRAAAAAAAAEEDGEDGQASKDAKHDIKAVKADLKSAPTFVALDPFTVNLADKTSERYAQVGITLEVDTAENAEKLKAYMPAIRNNVLMVLAHKTSEELLTRSGKERLAREIMRESVRPMGIEIEPDEEDSAESEEAPKPRKKKRRAVYNPVQQVHFSNFIVQ